MSEYYSSIKSSNYKNNKYEISFTFYDILYCSYMKNLQDTNHIQLILQSSIFNNLNQYYFDKFLYYLKLKELKENSYMLKGKKING